MDRGAAAAETRGGVRAAKRRGTRRGGERSARRVRHGMVSLVRHRKRPAGGTGIGGDRRRRRRVVIRPGRKRALRGGGDEALAAAPRPCGVPRRVSANLRGGGAGDGDDGESGKSGDGDDARGGAKEKEGRGERRARRPPRNDAVRNVGASLFKSVSAIEAMEEGKTPPTPVMRLNSSYSLITQMSWRATPPGR